MSWRGDARIQEIQALTHRYFPWIEHEIAGLADGLGLPCEDVFLWNCRGDLWAMAPDGCTTVLAPTSLTHNEDGDPGFAGACGLGKIRPIDGPSFVSFLYPGSLPGHTFAVNQEGLGVTVNNIRARRAEANGLPRMVLTRAVLATHSPSQAIALLHAHPRLGAFHLGLGQVGSAGTYSVEFSQPTVSVRLVRQNRQLHANHAIHDAQQALSQVVTDSSSRRQIRGDFLLQEQAAALDILADTGDAAEPVLRLSATDTDQENTLATADMDFSGDQVRWDVYAPGQRQAVFSFHGLHRLADL